MKSDKQRSDNLASSLTECIDQMQATPRTNVIAASFAGQDLTSTAYYIMLDHARELARELDDIKQVEFPKRVDIVRKAAIEQCATVCERMQPAGGRAWSEGQAACYEALGAAARNIRNLKRSTRIRGGQDGAEEK